MNSCNIKTDQLISLIYDSALDPSLWPTLLDQLLEEITRVQAELTESNRQLPHVLACVDNVPLMQTLLGHIKRSLSMGEQLKLKDEKSYLEEILFKQLPLPMLIISPSGEVLQSNMHADTFISNDNVISIRDHKLCLNKHSLQKKFDQILVKLAQPHLQDIEFNLRLEGHFDNAPISINLSRISDQYQFKGNILFLIASYDPDKSHDFLTIAEHFSLTPAEVRLLKKLVSAKTLKQIANMHQVSIHTVRSQLKSIFKKTGCSRQSELIKLIMNSPTLPAINISQQCLAKNHVNAPCYHNMMTLKDNRQLGYADIGLRSGLPIIMLHPSTGCRLQHPNDENILFDNKMRLILPDRPGFGLSDPNINQPLQSYADDIRELADQLQLNKFVLLGYCGGAPYALACSAKLADRVLHTLLISPISPYQAIDLFHRVKSTNKLLDRLALSFPSALQPILNLMARSLLMQPESYFDRVLHLSEGDQIGLPEPAVTDNILLALREALRQGTSAICHELFLFSGHWGIDFKAISNPISIWHGGADKHVSIDLVRKLQAELPNVTLNEVEHHGHLLIYYRWKDILESIKSC